MRFDSMMYTMGTALNRAMDFDIPVQILVGGQWLSGMILAVDGHGVVIDNGGTEHAVIKVEHISAVKLMAMAPMREEIAVATTFATSVNDEESAFSMPGPRAGSY
jgi:hypothetical protein